MKRLKFCYSLKMDASQPFQATPSVCQVAQLFAVPGWKEVLRGVKRLARGTTHGPRLAGSSSALFLQNPTAI